MQTFYAVDILSPHRVIARDLPATSLLVPTVSGQINLLEEHTHIVVNLSAGVLSVFGGASDPDRHFSVSSGICKVFGKKVHILAHVVEEGHEIDRERAERALANALEMLQGNPRKSLSEHEVAKYQDKVERAKLRIQLAQRTSK